MVCRWGYNLRILQERKGLPSAEYSFSYTIEEDVLYIDFAYEGAKDAQYTFRVEGDFLILEGGNSTTQGTLILKRVS